MRARYRCCWVTCRTEALALGVVLTDDTVSFPDASLYPGPMLHFAGLSQIECKLHSLQVIHLRAERLLDPQAHFARKRRFPIQQARKRLPRNA